MRHPWFSQERLILSTSNQGRELQLKSVPFIADTFQVSVSWIGKLLKRFRETGSVAPEPHRGGQPGAFQGEAAERLVQAVKDNPDATLKQLALIAGVSCSTSATDRMLRKLGITRKKSRYVLPNRTGPTSKPNELSGTKN